MTELTDARQRSGDGRWSTGTCIRQATVVLRDAEPSLTSWALLGTATAGVLSVHALSAESMHCVRPATCMW